MLSLGAKSTRAHQTRLTAAADDNDRAEHGSADDRFRRGEARAAADLSRSNESLCVSLG
jgi:hypothetical protein